jgi:hypothetical protein
MKSINCGEWFHGKVGELKDDVVRKSQAVENFRAKEKLAIGQGSEELFFARHFGSCRTIDTDTGKKIRC